MGYPKQLAGVGDGKENDWSCSGHGGRVGEDCALRRMRSTTLSCPGT